MLTASCVAHMPPVVELCVIGENGCICTDKRMPVPTYGKSMKECLNYLATNPRDYAEIRRWTEEIVSDLEKCEGRK